MMCLGFEPRTTILEGTDLSTELWRPPGFPLKSPSRSSVLVVKEGDYGFRGYEIESWHKVVY